MWHCKTSNNIKSTRCNNNFLNGNFNQRLKDFSLSVALLDGRVLIGAISITSRTWVQKSKTLPSHLPSKIVREERLCIIHCSNCDLLGKVCYVTS